MADLGKTPVLVQLRVVDQHMATAEHVTKLRYLQPVLFQIGDDPQLYENWRFAKVSHPRISSHHRDIDKTRYPDIGMRGQVVRE